MELPHNTQEDQLEDEDDLQEEDNLQEDQLQEDQAPTWNILTSAKGRSRSHSEADEEISARASKRLKLLATPDMHTANVGSSRAQAWSEGASTPVTRSSGPFANLPPATVPRQKRSLLGANLITAVPRESEPSFQIVDTARFISQPIISSMSEAGSCTDDLLGIIATHEATIKSLRSALEESQEKSREIEKRLKAAKQTAAWEQGRSAWEVFHMMQSAYCCSICLDIVAYPFSIAHPLCGHTFCAVCLLTWTFSHLNPATGVWDQELQCPDCRAPVPSIPLPQRPCLVPFLCNRGADIAIDGHFEYLDTIFERGHCDRKGKAREDAVVEDPIFPPDADETAEIMEWMRGGSQRVAWEDRCFGV